MSSSLALPLVLRAAEAVHSGPNPYLVGAIVLAIMVGMLLALVAFGGGREHT